MDTLQVTALDAGQEISVEVSEAEAPEGAEGPDEELFKLTVRSGSQEEVFDNLTLRRQKKS